SLWWNRPGAHDLPAARHAHGRTLVARERARARDDLLLHRADGRSVGPLARRGLGRPEIHFGSGADANVERSVARATGLPRPAKPARHARYARGMETFTRAPPRWASRRTIRTGRWPDHAGP